MSKNRPFEDIHPVTKLNMNTASREELISYIKKLEKELMCMKDTVLCWQAKEEAQSKPINPPERPRGEWIVIHNALGETKYQCNQCQHYSKPSDDKNFCGHCGADMRKGGTE